MRATLFRIGAIVLCVAGLSVAAGVKYTFSPVGKYPGAIDTYPLADNLTDLVGIWDASQVGGTYLETHFNGGGKPVFHAIVPPGSMGAYASAINNHGVIAGGYCTPPGGYCVYPNAQHGFTFENGKYTTIDFLPAVNAVTAVYGINDQGDIVGGYCTNPYLTTCPDGISTTPTTYGFLDNHGAFTRLVYPGAEGTQANAINNAGQIVGIYLINNTGPHSFLYQNGVYTNIDYPGSASTTARAINNHGVVSGFYHDPNTDTHGFLYRNGAFVRLDVPKSNNTSAVQGINDDGVVVGSWLSPRVQPFKGIPARAEAALP